MRKKQRAAPLVDDATRTLPIQRKLYECVIGTPSEDFGGRESRLMLWLFIGS
jgi:hypothetical protein